MNPINFGAEYLESAAPIAAGRTLMASVINIDSGRSVEDELLDGMLR